MTIVIFMQKSIAYFLLFSFVIYHLGFYIFYSTMDYKIDHQWNNSEVFHNQATKQMKIKYELNLPYMSSVPEVNQSHNSFSLKGVYYRVIDVVYNDGFLEFTYVLDLQKNKLENLIKKWGASHGGNGLLDSTSKLYKSLVKDFLPSNFLTQTNYYFNDHSTPAYLYTENKKNRNLEAPPIPPPIYS